MTNFPAMAITGVGIVFVYSGIKAVSILTTIQDLVTGKNPGTAPAVNAVVPATSGASGGTSGSAGSSVASYQAYAFSLFPQFGWGTDQKQPLISLWNQESGWNPTAQNPTSTAYGIAQFLDSTWGPYGQKTSDPATQITYGLEYIRNSYGSPAGAWAHEIADNWY